MDFYSRALELNDETRTHRRTLHQNAEVGLDLPRTRQYVLDALAKCGIHGELCGYGITATIGRADPEKGEKTILLRADMDALPMPEESGEPFACPTGKEAHGCGHDLHTAMLLTAAKMLKEREASLRGCVKLMFQPAEEILSGSRNMIENGILENPRPDAALAFHVAAGKLPIGRFMYNSGGVMMSSSDNFRITVHGRGGHGASPHLSVDPIHTAVQIYTALEGLIAREATPTQICVLTVGSFHAGNAPNVIPSEAYFEGTLRTKDNKLRETFLRRIREVALGIAEVNRATAEITILSATPALHCEKDFTDRVVTYLSEAGLPDTVLSPGMSNNGSEDFAEIAERIPSALLYVSAGYSDERGNYFAHNPKVRFNEEVLPIGAASYALVASRWLEEEAEKGTAKE